MCFYQCIQFDLFDLLFVLFFDVVLALIVEVFDNFTDRIMHENGGLFIFYGSESRLF